MVPDDLRVGEVVVVEGYLATTDLRSQCSVWPIPGQVGVVTYVDPLGVRVDVAGVPKSPGHDGCWFFSYTIDGDSLRRGGLAECTAMELMA